MRRGRMKIKQIKIQNDHHHFESEIFTERWSSQRRARKFLRGRKLCPGSKERVLLVPKLDNGELEGLLITSDLEITIRVW
jgi:hypothetical protein